MVEPRLLPRRYVRTCVCVRTSHCQPFVALTIMCRYFLFSVALFTSDDVTVHMSECGACPLHVGIGDWNWMLIAT